MLYTRDAMPSKSHARPIDTSRNYRVRSYALARKATDRYTRRSDGQKTRSKKNKENPQASSESDVTMLRRKDKPQASTKSNMTVRSESNTPSTNWYILNDDLDYYISQFFDPLSAIRYLYARFPTLYPTLSDYHVNSTSVSAVIVFKPGAYITEDDDDDDDNVPSPSSSSSPPTTLPPPTEAQLRVLRRCLPAQYIYCGKPGELMFRSLLDIKELTRSYMDHLVGCACVQSVIMKEQDLADPARLWRLDKREMSRLLGALKSMRRLYAPCR